jgi:hypothetical protein
MLILPEKMLCTFYEILAEYPAFQSGDECLIIKFFSKNRHHKEIFGKCYLSYNIVIPRLACPSIAMAKAGPGDPVCYFSSPLRGGLRWGLHILFIIETPSRLPLRGGGIKSDHPPSVA